MHCHAAKVIYWLCMYVHMCGSEQWKYQLSAVFTLGLPAYSDQGRPRLNCRLHRKWPKKVYNNFIISSVARGFRLFCILLPQIIKFLSWRWNYFRDSAFLVYGLMRLSLAFYSILCITAVCRLILPFLSSICVIFPYCTVHMYYTFFGSSSALNISGSERPFYQILL